MNRNGYYGGVTITMPGPMGLHQEQADAGDHERPAGRGRRAHMHQLHCGSLQYGPNPAHSGQPNLMASAFIRYPALHHLSQQQKAQSGGWRAVRPGRPVEANQLAALAGGARSMPANRITLTSSGNHQSAANGHHSSAPSNYYSSTSLSTSCQVLIAFLIAGFGNVGAGLILDHVKEWPVFLNVNELFILVPSLLGLKGNLEMTMASRLSTQANLGHMDNAHELLKMAKGNLALVQCQATVVSFVVAIFASLVKAMSAGATNGGQLLVANGGAAGGDPTIASAEMIASTYSFDWDNALILLASSLLTANIACFVLGTMMILVIVGSHRCRIDPDNIASPVAASLGDMTTAALLAVIAHSIYHYSEQQRLPYLALVITLLFLGMLPVWACVARSNPYTADVVTKGWTPIVIAVFISSCGGFILEYSKSQFSRLPVFQPVINGVGGNLVAVQASRLSTSLHRHGKPGDPIPAAACPTRNIHHHNHHHLQPTNTNNSIAIAYNDPSYQMHPPNQATSTTSDHQYHNQHQQQNLEPATKANLFMGPIEIFLKSKCDVNSATARLLLLMSIPAHLLYFFVIRSIEAESAVPLSGLFLSLYMLLAVLQVAILLFLAQNLVSFLWKCSIDPDNYSTPILTAFGDLLGCAFLLMVFVIAYQFNEPYAATIV